MYPLKAADFIKRGVAKRPALAAAEAAWIAEGFPDEASALDVIAVQAAASARAH